MEICTIGFAKKNLRTFIRKLQAAGVKKVIDIRLHNTSEEKGKFVIVDQSCSPRQVHLLPKDCKPADFKSISVPQWERENRL